jgi:hypothetical protein
MQHIFLKYQQTSAGLSFPEDRTLYGATFCAFVVKALCYKPEGHGFDTQ